MTGRGELARTAEDLPTLDAMTVVRLVLVELARQHVPHGVRVELGTARRAAGALLYSLGVEAEIRHGATDFAGPSNVVDMAAWRARRSA